MPGYIRENCALLALVLWTRHSYHHRLFLVAIDVLQTRVIFSCLEFKT